jgi:hypothetical protein
VKAFAKMTTIDDDKTLSREGKDLKQREIAEAAVTDFEKSKTLASARTSVERQMAKWAKETGIAPQPPATIAESVQLSEIRAYLSAMNGSRVDFVAKHATDPRVVAAVLGAPAFLSGLTDRRHRNYQDPSGQARRARGCRSLQEAEQGWAKRSTRLGSVPA